MKEECSKNTTRKMLDQLEESGIVVAEKENRRRYYLHIKNESLSATLVCKVQDFASAYGVLLEKTIKKLQILEKESNTDNHFDHRFDDIYLNGTNLLDALVYIYRYFTELCIFRQILNLHNEVKGAETLERINMLVYDTRREIQVRLSNAFSAASSLTKNKTKRDFMSSILSKPFAVDIESLYHVWRIFDCSGMAKELEPVLDIMWKDGSIN